MDIRSAGTVRGRSAGIGIVAAALLLTAGCATTVAGQPTTGSAVGRVGTSIPPVISENTGGTVESTPAATGAPQTDTAAPGTEGPTSSSTTSSAPATAETGTAAPTSGQPPAGTATSSAGAKGVPPVAPGKLRKTIGQAGGISDTKNIRTFNFTVTAIEPDYRSHCTDPATKQANGGTLIAVKISYQVLPNYKTADGLISLTPAVWSVRTVDGTVYRGLSTTSSKACLKTGLLPNRPLKAADKGSGWVVLESPARYGVLQLTEPNVDGGWEWIIPGS